MADKKLTQLDALTSVNYLDLSYVIDDPSGTPASKKCTAQNLVKGGASEGAIADLVDTTLTASKNLVSDGGGKVITTDDTWCRWRGSGSSTPTSPSEGDIWNDTTSGNTVKIYANGDWRALN